MTFKSDTPSNSSSGELPSGEAKVAWAPDHDPDLYPKVNEADKADEADEADEADKAEGGGSSVDLEGSVAKMQEASDQLVKLSFASAMREISHSKAAIQGNETTHAVNTFQGLPEKVQAVS